jgi:hypothetical protein
MNLCKDYELSLLLPESFEFILLYSKIFEKDDIVQEIIKDPLNHIESKYVSGEQYFTQVLTDASKRMELKYRKNTLFRCFIDKCCPRYKPCKANISDTSQDKLQSILDQIPVNLSNIFINNELNQEYIDANKDNSMYYQTIEDADKHKEG